MEIYKEVVTVRFLSKVVNANTKFTRTYWVEEKAINWSIGRVATTHNKNGKYVTPELFKELEDNYQLTIKKTIII